MKKLVYLLIVIEIGLFSNFLFSQNVGINSTGNAPNSSAMLDVDATNKGLLLPRMTTAQRDAIVNPALSLIIFNTTTNCYEGYSGVWQAINCPLPPAAVSALTCGSAVITGSVIQNVAPSGVSVSVPYTGGNGGAYSTQLISSTSVTGLIATLSTGVLANGSGNLMLNISGLATSSGTASFLFTFGGESCSFNLTVCVAAPGAFISSTATNVCKTNFTANWTASAGATAYLLDVSTNNTFSSFIPGCNNLNVGNVLTTNITGLTPGTQYYYRVRSFNGCATSANSNTIAQFTSMSGCDITQNAAAYGTTSYVGLTWTTRNLGALSQATSATDVSDEPAGCYFQFNRSTAFTNDLCDGATTVSPSWSITTIFENSNWTIANDPCRLQLGGAWRIPTDVEWNLADATGGWNNYNDAFSSILKLHCAGRLQDSNGTLANRGDGGYFATSTQVNGSNGLILGALVGSCAFGLESKAKGISVRCVF